MIDQSPIGRTPRSNPVTYIKAFDTIRALVRLHARSREARLHGRPFLVQHSRRALRNLPGRRHRDGGDAVPGRRGTDLRRVQGHALQERHPGDRYNGLNIHEVLQLTVREAMTFFHAAPRLVQKLKVLDDVGLGYLRLGQSATTLSGGEAQRVKLAAHLATASCAGTLFIFDEPTTGLHFDDIAKLLAQFQRLIENGGSLIVIEHNLDVIKAADWVIDLGPEGGARGGSHGGRGHARRASPQVADVVHRAISAHLRADCEV